MFLDDLELCDVCGENEPTEVCKFCMLIYCQDCIEPKEHNCEEKI